MDEDRYNNRQLERIIDQQSTDIKDYLAEVINPLTTQVTLTNGRVRSLEGYRNLLVGFCSCMVLIVIPTLAFLALQIFTNSNNIAALTAIIKQ